MLTKEQAVIDGLKEKIFFHRFIGHVGATFRHWYHGHTVLYDELIRRYHPTAKSRALADILGTSPFTGTSINIGPRALATNHRDSANLLNGPCAIGVFGNFDGTTAAQVIFHEAKVICEYIPGDVYYVLSSSISHENLDMPEGCVRQCHGSI